LEGVLALIEAASKPSILLRPELPAQPGGELLFTEARPAPSAFGRTRTR